MKKKTVWISEKDMKLFNFLHSTKVARIDQLHRDLKIFKSIRCLYNRISKLRFAGYLEVFCHQRFRNKSIVNLTSKAFEKYISDGCLVRKELKSKSVVHDLTLVDIRNRICSSNQILEYYTENFLQTWTGVKLKKDVEPFVETRCDALIGFKVSEGILHLALEYEASEKSDGRYGNIISKYYVNEDVAGVLYICETQEMMQKLLEKERDLYSHVRPKFFYTTLDKFMTDSKLRFEAHNGRKLELGPLAQPDD